MNQNIPKFTSFRPKPKPAAEPLKEEARRPDQVQKEKGRDSTRRSPSRVDRDRKHDSIPSRSTHEDKKSQRDKTRTRDDGKTSPERTERDRKYDSRGSPPRASKDVKLDPPAPRSYFSDRRGDPGVFKYGSLDRRDVPAFRRHGYGCILGLPVGEKIDREYSTDRKIYTIPTTRRRQERLLTKKNGTRDGSRLLRLVKIDHSNADVDRDFISLSGTGKRKRSEAMSDEDSDDGQAPDLDYRGIEGKRTSEPADPDTHYESDTQDTSTNPEITKRNSELVRMTREQPHDLQAWRDLIDHQEAMMKLDRSASELSTSDKQHLADVRISTYEQALRKTADDPAAQIELYLGLLHEARRHWDELKLANKWQDVLAKHPHSMLLWLEYLDFVQSSFNRFGYEDCKTAFLRCFKALSSSNDASANDMLHIFIRLTSMIQEAGYQELALALWQGMIQYKSMSSSGTASSQNDLVHRFSEDWESEVPRIGELETADQPSPTIAASSGSSSLSGSVFEKFQHRETELMNQLRYPGRSTDEAGEDDPFHIIFFSDMEDYLQIIMADIPCATVVQAFLCFCRLPPPLHADIPGQKWWTDPFLQRRATRFLNQDNEETGVNGSMVRYLNVSLHSYQMTIELLMKQDFSLSDVRLDAAFVRRLLQTLAADVAIDESFGEYLLAFELRHFPSDAPKTAKSLLKARPTSLRLYSAYGLVESCRGNSARAEQVFSMALSMQKGDHPLSSSDALGLLSNWVWEALRKGQRPEALWRLASPHGKVPTRIDPTALPETEVLIRARELISAATERALLSQDYTSAVISTSLLAIHSYLSNDFDPEAALAIHRGLSSWFFSHKLSTSPYAELQAQSVCRFLAHHTTHAPIVKPSLIRDALEPLIVSFPDNTTLLSLYAANEARFAVDDRVRSIMHHTALHRSAHTSVAGWAFAIHHETLKGEVAGSTAHSIRALYKRAVDEAGASCPALWCNYLLFEVKQLEKERVRRLGEKTKRDGKKSKWEMRADEAGQRVKDVFYAGLKKLPWCKEFILLMFKFTRDAFTEEELWRVYHVMVEKELRLYVELDDSKA